MNELAVNPSAALAAPRSLAIAGSSAPLPVVLAGISFDPVTTDQAVRRIQEMIARRRPTQVVTANLDFLFLAHRDRELREILRRADLTLCDGMPLVWAARLLGNPLPERVTGADLVPRLLSQASRHRQRVFLLGGLPAAGARALQHIRDHYPGVIATHYSPPFAPLDRMDHDNLILRIRAARPDLLLVSFGCPKAEKWIARHLDLLGVPVSIGVGATIDFLAGRMHRAPLWMQRCGLEWVYRLLQEPRRLLSRYAADLAFFGKALPRQWWMGKSHRPHQPAPPAQVAVEGDWQCLALGGWVDAGALRRDEAQWEKMIDVRRDCVVDLTQAEGLDSSTAARLVGLQRALKAAGRHLVLFAPGRAVRETLRAMMLDDVFTVARNLAEACMLLHPPTRRGPSPHP